MEKSPQKISATTDHPYEQLRPEDDGYISDDFEFSVASSDPDTSDEVSGPIFPVFNRDLIPAARSAPEKEPSSNSFQQLLIRDRADRTASASSSPDRAKIDGEKSRKSSSTGSSTSNSWGLREIVGRRSNSDGREKFVLLERPPPEKPIPNPNPNPKISSAAAAMAAEGEKGKKGGKTGKATEMDMVTAHRLFYGKGSGQGTKGSRRTYLPYRQELLMGFFANGTPH